MRLYYLVHRRIGDIGLGLRVRIDIADVVDALNSITRLCAHTCVATILPYHVIFGSL